MRFESTYGPIDVVRVVWHRNGSCASFYVMEFTTQEPVRGATHFLATFETLELDDGSAKVNECFLVAPGAHTDGNPYFSQYRGTTWLAEAAERAVARYQKELAWLEEISETVSELDLPQPDWVEESIDHVRRLTHEAKALATDYDFQVIDPVQYGEAQYLNAVEILQRDLG